MQRYRSGGSGIAALVLLLLVAFMLAMVPDDAEARGRMAPPPKQMCVPAQAYTPEQVMNTQRLLLGLQDQRSILGHPSKIGGRVDRIASLNVKVVRVDVLWSHVAPRRPGAGQETNPRAKAYNWKRYDRLFRGLDRCGITIIANFYRAPWWANRPPADIPFPQSAGWVPHVVDANGVAVPEQRFLAHAQNFFTAFARRYSGKFKIRLGGNRFIMLPRVGIVEAWNEPNMPHFLLPQRVNGRAFSVGAYCSILAKARAAFQGSYVIGPSTGSSSSIQTPNGPVGTRPFNRAMRGCGVKPDAQAIHIYTAQIGKNGWIDPSLSQSFPSFGTLDSQVIPEWDSVVPGQRTFVTELGWTTSPTSHRPNVQPLDQHQQLASFNSAVRAMAQNPRVGVAIYFDLQDNRAWGSGLLTINGSPKAIYPNFAQTAREYSRLS